MASSGLRFAWLDRPVRLPAAVSPIPRRGVLHLRPYAGLAGENRVRFRASDVPARPVEWLSRTRCRMASGRFALDPGLSARGPAFFPGGAPPDPSSHA